MPGISALTVAKPLITRTFGLSSCRLVTIENGQNLNKEWKGIQLIARIKIDLILKFMFRDEEVQALEEEVLLIQKRVGPIADYKQSLGKAHDNTTDAMQTFVRHLAQGNKINQSIDETIVQASEELETTCKSANEIGISIQHAQEEVSSFPFYT